VGDVSEGFSNIYNIVPDISIAQNLIGLGLEVGQPVKGAGIPPGTVITLLDTANNQIDTNNEILITAQSQEFTGAKIPSRITIK
jgi:hypothetical protein